MAIHHIIISALTILSRHLVSSAPTTSSPLPTASADGLPPLVTLEDHYISHAFLNSSWAVDGDELRLDLFSADLISEAEDVGAERVANLTAAGIQKQVISHFPSVHVPPANLCIAANTELASDVSGHPDRLAGFALLPMLEPDEAVAELERTVTQLGFLGTLIPNHADGRYYDDDFFWPIFEKAQELDVPVYIHPTWVADDEASHFIGNFSEVVSATLGAYGYGWHVDTGLTFLRAWAGGLFDAFPNLKIILGHDGEAIPFWLNRMEGFLNPVTPSGARSLLDVWNTNVWVTTSGQFTLEPFTSMLGTVNVSRIMFSVDYPFAPNSKGVGFMETLRDSGLVTSDELEMIAHGNAEQLLKING